MGMARYKGWYCGLVGCETASFDMYVVGGAPHKCTDSPFTEIKVYQKTGGEIPIKNNTFITNILLQTEIEVE